MRKKLISMFFLINIIFIIICIFQNISNAADVKQTLSADYNSLDDNKYPGIKAKINELRKQFPTWNFKILYTGIKWEDAIKYEYTGHGGSPKNLVPISSNYSGNWICPICKDEVYDSGSWKCASEEAIKYMMDPRNSINASDVFQFLELSFDQKITYSKDKIKSMLSGSFLQEEKYTNTILDSCKKFNVNPYYIVARILQEQKKEGTTLTKGQGYKGQYVGYYNVFNIGASGKGTEKVILNGLAKAKVNGWDSLEKSLSGGIEIIAQRYIALGQNTMYLQKFDVDNTDGNMYWHQYMQNILAAQNEGETLRKTISSINALGSNYNFIIPVYENMPKSIAARPSTTKELASVSTDLVKINVNSSLKIRNKPAVGDTVGYVYAGEIVTRIEKANTKVNGTYWDKILSSSGVEGYVARCTFDGDSNYKLYLVPLNDTQDNNDDKSDNSNESQKKTDSNTSNSKILKGDVNCDGKVTSSDYVLIKNHIMSVKQLTEDAKKYADYNEDGKITSSDYVLIKNYIMSK